MYMLFVYAFEKTISTIFEMRQRPSYQNPK